MAFSSCSRRLMINRGAISSVKSIFPSKKILPTSPLSANISSSSPTRPFSSLSRSRAALGCVHSLLPLHSAVAAARLTSCLSSSSLGSRSLSQGYGISEGRCFPCSGISGRVAVSSYSCPRDYKPFSRVKILLRNNTLYDTKSPSFLCTASSGGHRRNPDFSRQNKQGHGFSRGKNRHNQERDSNSDNLEESEFLSSKNGPLLSLSGSPRFQATATPGPREKEIVELFRKVQAQLRERAAIKEEKKIEASQGERGTVDSLLKLLRKHSVKQGKKSSSGEDFNLEQPERNSSPFDDEQNSNFFNTNTIATDEVQEPSTAHFTRPASNFQRKSPVPRVKYQPVYSTDENIPPSPSPKSQGKRNKNVIELDPVPDPEPISLDVQDDAVFDELSESSDTDEAYDEITEPSPTEDVDLSSSKLPELRALAKSRGVKGYSKLKKGELVELLSRNVS